MEIWYYDSYYKRPIMASGFEEFVRNAAQRDLGRKWALMPIYFFAELTTEDV